MLRHGVCFCLFDDLLRLCCCCLVQGNFEEVATFLVEGGADPNDVYTDEKGKEHNLLFDSVTLGNEVRFAVPVFSFLCVMCGNSFVVFCFSWTAALLGTMVRFTRFCLCVLVWFAVVLRIELCLFFSRLSTVFYWGMTVPPVFSF